MSDADYSVLPDNRSSLERGLELAFQQQLDAIENPYPALLRPYEISTELLPHLAQDRGVTDWGADDTEKARRDTVAGQFIATRLAGTAAGVKAAVDSLGFDAEVGRGDGPYQLSISLWQTGVGSFEADLYARVDRRISQVKSERDVYSVNVGLKARSDLVVAAYALAGDRVSVRPYSIGELSGSGVCGVGVGAMLFDLISIYPEGI